MMWCDTSHSTGLPIWWSHQKRFYMFQLHILWDHCMGAGACGSVYVCFIVAMGCLSTSNRKSFHHAICAKKNLSFFRTLSSCHQRRCHYDRYCRFASLSFHRRLFWYSKFIATKFIYMQWTACSVIPGNPKQIHIFLLPHLNIVYAVSRTDDDDNGK